MSGAMQVQIDLDYPIQVDGVEVRYLTMRRPKVRDQKIADAQGGSDGEREIRLFANLCAVAPRDIEDLDMADYAQLQGVFADFLNRKSVMKTSA